MMYPATIVILVVTLGATIAAFARPVLQERWIFDPEAILKSKQYERMFTCGLIHGDWLHFGLNAFSLHAFGRLIETVYGVKTLLVIYLSSILGGSLLSLLIHRHHVYRALGASGGVCGIIFASIFLLPGGSISLMLVPVGIPAYLYAVLFLLGSYFGHRQQLGNIGHDAHLGGAIVGLLVTTALYPRVVLVSPGMYATVLGLSLIILVFLLRGPLALIRRPFGAGVPVTGGERERRYAENRRRNEQMAEMDGLLEKVAAVGLENLSGTERKRLEELSRLMGGRE